MRVGKRFEMKLLGSIQGSVNFVLSNYDIESFSHMGRTGLNIDSVSSGSLEAMVNKQRTTVI